MQFYWLHILVCSLKFEYLAESEQIMKMLKGKKRSSFALNERIYKIHFDFGKYIQSFPTPQKKNLNILDLPSTKGILRTYYFQI